MFDHRFLLLRPYEHEDLRKANDTEDSLLRCNRLVKNCCMSCIIGLLALGMSLTICASIEKVPNISSDFISSHLQGDPSFGWWRLPQRSEEILEEIREQLVNKSLYPNFIVKDNNLTLGYTTAGDAIHFMYQATRVPGVFEQVPKHFRGVFWMKGNGVGEVLTVLQYSRWFEEEQILIFPMAPFTWAWPHGKPPKAPFGGVLYDETATVIGSSILVSGGKPHSPPVVFSVAFGDSNLTYGALEAHPGDLRIDGNNLKSMAPDLPSWTKYANGKYTMEALPDTTGEPGSLWKRGCYWGIGACDCLEFGSYTLTKVLKGNGHPNEPHHSEFLNYMGDVPVFMWTGFKE